MLNISEVSSKLTTAACDAAYMTAGLGVVAGERLRTKARRLATTLDSRLEAVESRIETVVDRIERRLPEQAEHLLGQARGVTKVARDQLRTLVRPAA